MSSTTRSQETADAIQTLANQMIALTNALNTTQQQLQDLINANAAAGAPPAPAAVAFAETPAKADPTAILDYTSKYGLAVYNYGKSSLYDEGTAKFDLDREKASRFEKDIKARVESMGWDHPIQGITTYTDSDGTSLNIIEDYGRISQEEIEDQAKPIYLTTGAKSSARAAQNNYMMSVMLMNSITPEAKTQVEVFKNEYEFSDGGVPGKQVTVAAALYKVIMKLTTMDDKSTNTALREAINDLPEYAVAVNGDITKINTYFDTKYAQLKARGGNIDDKESLLFKTYANVPDGEFKDWVKLRKDDWFAERNEMKGADYLKIMQLARQKYTNLLNDKTHVWGSPTSSEQQIIALQGLLDKQLKLTSDLQAKIDTDTPPSNSNGGNNNSNNGKGGGKNGKGKGKGKWKNKKNTSNKSKQKEDEAWKKIAPKQGEPNTKLIGTRTWNWCPHHQAWTVHKAIECKLGQQQAEKRSTIANEATTTPSASSTTQLNPSYAAMLAQIAAQSE